MSDHKYQNLADLRGALRSDDDDTLQEAYEAVYDAETKPSKVLGSNPPEKKLVQAGVIPPKSDEPPVRQIYEDQLAELKAINKALESLETAVRKANSSTNSTSGGN